MLDPAQGMPALTAGFIWGAVRLTWFNNAEMKDEKCCVVPGTPERRNPFLKILTGLEAG